MGPMWRNTMPTMPTRGARQSRARPRVGHAGGVEEVERKDEGDYGYGAARERHDDTGGGGKTRMGGLEKR
ncbi:hypothetical protein E2562_015216 [Oryza meyeriana var. granulata]|uniref:Uncharacterized protein n=1 Tax=Oryza meyeriana var. granulata TaxID=110450 RepID=A0A6G1EWZ8_9ORYZ|nr:hypothetical protein E2562_015216 [Oryza meyeriana var. granulata]